MEYTFYKIQVGNECYVGSTKDFKSRMSGHKHSCHHDKDTNYNYEVYKSIRELGWDKIEVMVIDKMIYNYKHEAFDMETKYMNIFDAKLNSRYPKRSAKEYYEANKEKISEKDRKYYEANKEKISERERKYYEANKEKVLKQRQKYYEAIKEKKLEKRKQYYEANKEKMKEKNPCEICNKCLRRDTMKNHMKSQH